MIFTGVSDCCASGVGVGAGVFGEQAAKELEELLRFRLEELMAARKGEILRTDFVTRQENGRLTVTLLAECREEIGESVPIYTEEPDD